MSYVTNMAILTLPAKTNYENVVCRRYAALQYAYAVNERIGLTYAVTLALRH